MTFPLPEIICSVGSNIFSSSSVTGLRTGLTLAFLPFLLRGFFCGTSSSSGRRMPIVFFGRFQHVADRRFDEIILPQILIDGLRLRRRLHYSTNEP